MDSLRDDAEGPDDLLSGIVEVMARALAADTCLLFVTDTSTSEQELRAIQDHSGKLSELSSEDLVSLSRDIGQTPRIEIREGLRARSALPRDADGGQVAVVPIVMGGEDRVGTLLLVRADRPFDASEVDLLSFAETQLDSALVQAQRLHELDLRSRELETIYRVDRIRDTPLGFDEMLDRVLNELRRVIHSEVAFILLYDRAGKQLELSATSPEDLTTHWPGAGEIESAANEAVRVGELILRESPEHGIGSIMCVPLILREEILGVFGMAHSGSGRFKEGEQRLLRAIASQMDTAIFENLEQGRLRQVLGRTVDPQVLERLLEHSVEGILEGERHVLTVLYADLRGSTHLAETADPKELVEFINDYLGEMAEIIVKHKGTLDKFMGDAVMALFGAPLPMDDHALRAVRVGLEMQEVHRTIMDRWADRGLTAPPLGVGIATGEMIVGEMGSGRHSDYTVLGAPANLGARICGVAKAGQVLVSAETYSQVKDQVEAHPISGMRFKGIAGEVTVFGVRGRQIG
jgi:adenylate cyclase